MSGHFVVQIDVGLYALVINTYAFDWAPPKSNLSKETGRQSCVLEGSVSAKPHSELNWTEALLELLGSVYTYRYFRFLLQLENGIWASIFSFKFELVFYVKLYFTFCNIFRLTYVLASLICRYFHFILHVQWDIIINQ